MKTFNELAREAGGSYLIGPSIWRFNPQNLERFAYMVREQTLEEAAKLAESVASIPASVIRGRIPFKPL